MEQRRTSIGRLLMSSLLFVALSHIVHGQQSLSVNWLGPPDLCRSVLVFGAVRAPSRFEFRKNVRLSELIACAGGLTDNAGKYAQILHAGQWESCSKSGDSSKQTRPTGTTESYYPELYSLAAVASSAEKSNPVVQAGDIIVVLELDPVYITGDVVAPQAIYLKGTLTLTQAIATAGGLTRGKTDGIRIIRQTPGYSGRTEIIVDLKAIRKRRAEDPVLQPFDIVEVPEKLRGDRVWGRVIGIDPVLPLRAVCEDSRFLSAK
jgi:protein involved in polysaccharide export with SLBB domain